MTTLRAVDLTASYRGTPALRGVSFEVRSGQLVALLGRNGAGKTTTLRAIAGLTPIQSGQVMLDGESLEHRAPHQISRMGIGLVPQQRRIFADLTVAENLKVAHLRRRGALAQRLAFAYELFPKLHERREQNAATLSGGEQQMLAIARALMPEPRALLLDEPMEGLSPAIIEHVIAALAGLRAAGMAIVLVEQIVSAALQIADYAYVLDRGEIVYRSRPAVLKADGATLSEYLGIGTV